MDASFTAQGDWFVFGQDGRTLKRGFRSKEQAHAWIRAQLRKEAA